jgi:hypothetical protein
VTSTKNSLSTLFLTLALCVSVAAQDGSAPVSTDTAGPVSAENWWHKFWGQVDLHRKRVNVWPEPFVGHDRELVRGPFRQMADNGWKTQNTFSDYLFDPGSNELTSAGQAKLAYILTQTPPHRRQVYVLEGASQEDTAARVASMYRSVTQIAPDSGPCAVMTTKIAPRGGEGWYAYEVENAYRASLPLPRAFNPNLGSSSNGMGGLGNNGGNNGGFNNGNNGNGANNASRGTNQFGR